ncbi:MAG TPA: lipocalin family protein [Cytophagaceae bacterium]
MYYKKILLQIFILSLYWVFGCTTAEKQTLQTVPSVDLKRYSGKWFEIASFPQRFQKGCHATMVEYIPTAEGYIIVKNACNKDSLTGKRSSIKGKAFVVKNSGNAKLKVQFFWPFKGDYWIIDLAEDYSYAVVSNPERDSLWILSRSPEMNESVYRAIRARLEGKGFDLARLQKTPQR